MPQVPQNIEREHLLKAIEEIERDGVPSGAQSTGYDLVHEGKRYPPKLVVAKANRFANGVELNRMSFHGGVGTDAFNLLERRGFRIESKRDSFEDGYQRLRQRFLTALPNFAGFDNDERYRARERNYKDELVDRFRQRVKPEIDRGAWNLVGKGFLDLLKRPLLSNDKKPQNIVGWRYIEWLTKGPPETSEKFGSAVGSLLDERLPLEKRVADFVVVLRTLVGAASASFPALSRSIATFALTLSDPNAHLFLKTNEIEKAVRFFDQSFRWKKGGLDATELELIEELAHRLFERLTAEGWRPKDLIDVQSFLWVATAYPEPVMEPLQTLEANERENKMMIKAPLNQVLYGPPGTGKTYHTVNKALEILDPAYIAQHADDRDALRRRFDELRSKGRIAMVTFHQSFSYEDFVEGLRASTTESGQIRYDVEDGIFKRMCSAASSRKTGGSAETVDPRGRRIWKMSLGNTQGDDAYVFDECLATHQILLGYGSAIDFSGAGSREEVRRRHHNVNPNAREFSVSAVHRFVNEMKKGDLVVISDGNRKFRAIGEIMGDYRHLEREDNYVQSRAVRWLRVFSPSLPHEQLMERVFSQMTLYQLDLESQELEKLAELLRAAGPDDPATPYVLIIDELNRGNVANIFGELITLIEDNRRIGASEETTVTLPYSKTHFGVPANLYLICTMNTADRSLVHLDTALRRRFEFEELMPEPGVLISSGIDEIDGVNVVAVMEAINRRIELIYDREHTLGHSFFLPLIREPTIEGLARIFDKTILPLLQEYFFEDWAKIRQVLGDDQKNDSALCFVTEAYSAAEIQDALGSDVADQREERAFKRGRLAPRSPDAYRLIYERDEA